MQNFGRGISSGSSGGAFGKKKGAGSLLGYHPNLKHINQLLKLIDGGLATGKATGEAPLSLGWCLASTMLNNVGGLDAIVNCPPRWSGDDLCCGGGAALQPSWFQFPVPPGS
jgi:hypothetical protein